MSKFQVILENEDDGIERNLEFIVVATSCTIDDQYNCILHIDDALLECPSKIISIVPVSEIVQKTIPHEEQKHYKKIRSGEENHIHDNLFEWGRTRNSIK